MPESIAAEKAALRARFGAYRAALDEAEYARRSVAIAAQARRLPELRQAGTVHTYWPLTHRREVDTRPLIDALQQAGKRIVLPVVAAFGETEGGRPRLRHLCYERGSALRANRWGIHEPVAGTSVPVADLDAVIVPALGAGRNGHRIGHGYGYYDELLRALRVPLIGLVYAACLVEAVPASAHDVPLSVIVTEDEIFRPCRRVTS